MSMKSTPVHGSQKRSDGVQPPPPANKGSDPKPSTSKTAEMSDISPPGASSAPAGPPPSTTSAKKKKPTRTERQARREDAVLKALYAPKQSRVTLISPAIMKLMNKNAQESTKVTPVTYPPLLGGTKSTDEGTPSTFDQEFPNVSSCYLDDAKKRVNVAEQEVRATPTLAEGRLPPSSSVRKSKNKHTPYKAPLVINLEELLPSGNLKKQGRRDKKKAAAAGKSNFLQEKTKVRPVGNILDSSGLTFIHRGKMREKPKMKRPTKLKKAIITSRSLRKVTIGKHFEGTCAAVTEATPTPLDPQAFPVAEGIPDPIKTEPKEEDATEEGPVKLDSPEIPGPSAEPENIFRKLLEDALHPKQAPEPEQSRAPIPSLVPETDAMTDELRSRVKERMHPKPKKFRTYCDMYLSKELHGHVIELMKELHRFQDRLYHSDPIKFKTHKRYISGFREVIASLLLDKIKLIIIAPDIEPNDVKGGLDDKIEELLSTAKGKGIPYLFSGNRFILGKPIKVKSQVAIIGILNKQGAEEFVEKVLAETAKLREAYNQDYNSISQELMLMRIES